MTDGKLSYEQLEKMTDACPEDLTRWRHYKGGEYLVVGSAIQEGTLTLLVLYAPVGEFVTFARPLSEWEAGMVVDGKLVPRFRRVDP